MNQNQNKSKHTPGPWTHARMIISPQAKDRRCGFVVNGPNAYDQSLPTRICDLRVPSGINGFSEGEANARLIAAAPQLLEALKSAELSTVQIRMAADIGDKTLRGKIAWYEGQLEQLRDELRAAISKAEGQA